MMALDMLLRQLGGGGSWSPRPQQQLLQGRFATPEEMAFMERQIQAREQERQRSIVGLPEVVQRSILENPQHDEGQVMAPRQWYNPAFDAEQMLPLTSPERRENRLNDELGLNRYLRSEGPWAMPEGQWLAPRPGEPPAFASPLNQLLQRGPFALY